MTQTSIYVLCQSSSTFHNKFTICPQIRLLLCVGTNVLSTVFCSLAMMDYSAFCDQPKVMNLKNIISGLAIVMVVAMASDHILFSHESSRASGVAPFLSPLARAIMGRMPGLGLHLPLPAFLFSSYSTLRNHLISVQSALVSFAAFRFYCKFTPCRTRCSQQNKQANSTFPPSATAIWRLDGANLGQ